MKKITLTIIALCIFAGSFAQENKKTNQQVKIDENQMQLNIGTGLSTWGFPLYIGADYWVNEDITLGIQGSIRYRLLHKSRYGYFGGSVNANYHFSNIMDLIEELDIYAGLSAGPYIGFGNYYSGATVDFGIRAQVGGRYQVNDNIWLHGELGGGTFSGAKIGITITK